MRTGNQRLLRSCVAEGRAIAYRASIRDLAQRLSEKGFSWPFVKSCVLPEWWDDKMADVEANRALAEVYIAKHLGFGMEELQDRARPLSPPRMAGVRFKRYKNEADVDDKARASAVVALSMASSLVWAISSGLPQLQRRSAREVRDAILRESRYVDLDTLLAFCWGAGIPVLRLDRTPGKRFDGMAAFADGRPVIVLASCRDSPPWLAFYVAHELGHIMLGHVRADTGAWLDVKIDSDVHSQDERNADRFACEVLSGFAEPKIKDLRLKAHPLALTAARSGPEQGVDPGAFALIYARSNNRWAVAQDALKYLGLGTGGRARIAEHMAEHLSDSELPESEERFLSALTSG